MQTSLNVIPKDGDISVSVRAGLFMVEAQGVENFMLHHTDSHAAWTSQRDVLSSPLTTNVGPTPGTNQDIEALSLNI